MRNLVEAGFDVALHDPLIGVGREVAHLGHRVMGPALRTEPERTREEIRLEDRLQHQFQRRLYHPIRDGGDPEAALLAARLGNHPLPHRQRPKTTVLQRSPQRVEELLDSGPLHDGHSRAAVHPGGSGALVPPHPNPRNQEERGIGKHR
jgi:hypothetical protein